MSSGIRSKPHPNIAAATCIPFPVLKTLRLKSLYPFTNDIIFRGNSGTLEYLEFHIDKDTVNMLNSARVFENKHKVLQNVTVAKISDNDNNPLESGADMNIFFSNLTSNAQVLKLSTPLMFEAMMATAQHRHGFNHIQVLTVGSSRLSLFNVLSLLKVLPNLMDLTCVIDRLGTELEHIDTDILPDYIVATYGGIGRYLKSWTNTGYTNLRNSEEVIKYIMLLTLVCPRLHRLGVVNHTIPILKRIVGTALESNPFNKYAVRLGLLVDFIR
ncbi:hypothetical protein LPJ71_001188 [Coemansia sp. S17]|nr:hypothetical protein LPJ71_001188 [Coemansia sp. S17]